MTYPLRTYYRMTVHMQFWKAIYCLKWHVEFSTTREPLLQTYKLTFRIGTLRHFKNAGIQTCTKFLKKTKIIMHVETDSCTGGRKNEPKTRRNICLMRNWCEGVSTRKIWYNPRDDNDGDIKVIKVLKVDCCCSIRCGLEGLLAKCQ